MKIGSTDHLFNTGHNGLNQERRIMRQLSRNTSLEIGIIHRGKALTIF